MVWNLDLLVSYENYGCVPENPFASHTTHYSSPKHEINGKIRACEADFQVGGLTRTRKRDPTRGVRGHAPPGKFETLFF